MLVSNMFKRLADAVESIGLHKNKIIIAEDITVSGQKKFYVDTVANLDRKYQRMGAKHWYECLLEKRPCRIFLDIESPTAVDLTAILTSLKDAAQLQFKIDPIIEVLDSCSAAKQSWHVVITNIYLKNVYHVGAFVRRLVLFTNEEAIDTAVYTRNRMFRVKGSSKFGSDRVLKHGGSWNETLIQWPVPLSHYECLEIDGSVPVSQSKSPHALFEYVDNAFVSRSPSSRSSSSRQCLVPPFLGPLLKRLDTMTGGNLYQHNLTMTDRGQLFCSTKSKQCSIAKRQHKGNNIWFEIDLIEQRVFQRCYDDECRGKRHEITGLDSLWIEWNNWLQVEQYDHSWSPERFTPNNEKTLYNMVD